MKPLLGARHYSNDFTHTSSLIPHRHPPSPPSPQMGIVAVLIDEETEAQRVQATCPKSSSW